MESRDACGKHIVDESGRWSVMPSHQESADVVTLHINAEVSGDRRM